MSRRRSWMVTAGIIVTVVIMGLVVRNQVKVYRNRAKGEEERRAREAVIERRQALYDMLQPVALTNCRLERFGEANDGGYLMCANLLEAVQSGYSYGISGYDKWGCDMSSRLGIPLHEYDCFDTTQPVCPTGRTVFHAECVSDRPRTELGRFFDSIPNQITRNGDGAKRIVLKIDVEGAEWDAFAATPDEVLQQIDQLAVEFHWVHDDKHQWVHNEEKYVRVISRLKEFFHVAHVHQNNYSCVSGLEPFPAWAYEVLFVSKRLGLADAGSTPQGLSSLDAPNNPKIADCQTAVQ
jgi:hypothetical protein